MKCSARLLEKYRRHYWRNREKISARKKRWQQNNREAIAARKRKHYEKNRERILEQRRHIDRHAYRTSAPSSAAKRAAVLRYRAENLEKCRQREKEYARTHKKYIAVKRKNKSAIKKLSKKTPAFFTAVAGLDAITSINPNNKMKKAIDKNAIDKKVKLFADLVWQGTEYLFSAGLVAKDLFELDKTIPERISGLTKGITRETFMGFVQIGRKQLHPQLLMTDAPGALALRQLPFDLQEYYLTNPIKVVADGKTVEEGVMSLTRDQTRQVFDGNLKILRSPEEQVAYLKSIELRRSAGPASNGTPYRVDKDMLVINRPCTLKRKDLLRLLQEME